ncbi:hypothetical protein JTL90_33180, partial [Pseudomonas aeruginosa]|nr:hypothetical protein [Pseudomonas aeruginosa]
KQTFASLLYSWRKTADEWLNLILLTKMKPGTVWCLPLRKEILIIRLKPVYVLVCHAFCR